jgi:predicted AAA+ superfamily ATPase
MADTGLLISMAFDEKGRVPNEIYQKLLHNKLEINEGMLVENIVAQMLTAAGHQLYFYSNSSRENAGERMEIDFLVSKGKITSRHNIFPIEVKSSTRYTLSSLKKCMVKFGDFLATPYVLHGKDLQEKDGITYLPLYMAELL